jgi:hypothetical protein
MDLCYLDWCFHFGATVFLDVERLQELKDVQVHSHKYVSGLEEEKGSTKYEIPHSNVKARDKLGHRPTLSCNLTTSYYT